MLARTKFFLFLFVLHCPPSLLIPLKQQDAVTTSNTNNFVVLRTNQLEQITQNNSIATELIQQIDVKDHGNQAISNIHHVVVTDENIQNNNNGTQNNVTNDLVAHNLKVSIENTSSSLNDAGVTNPLNDSSSLLLINLQNNTSGNTLKAENITIHGLQNNLGNKTGVPLLETVDGENTLHENLSAAEVELAWRSDIPVGKNKTKKLKHIAKLDSQNVTLQAHTINGDLLDSENNEQKSIFVILNSGNIDGLSVNSPANNGNLQIYSDNNRIKNNNSSNSKLLNNLINSTINDVLSKILQQNHSNLNSTHIFLLVNSGSISNVHVSSPVLEKIVKNTTLKDRLRRHLNESNTNNTNVESVTLKPSTDKSNHIIDIKFRTGEHQGTQNNVKNVTIIPLDNNYNTSSLGSNAPDNSILGNSDATVVDLIKDEEISSAEAAAFRSLIPDKIRKLQQVSHVINNELNETKEHNLVVKLSPESTPRSIDLNQLPLNNLLDGALSFIKRLKRNTHDKVENSYPLETNCKTKQIDEHHTVKSCKKSKLFNDDLTIETIATRKSFGDNISNVLKLFESVELVCPLSFIVKLYTHKVLDNPSKNHPDSVLNKILSSFMNGNEDAINLASQELFNVPIPVKLRLQLVHGKTKEFMEQLSEIVDATLCSMS